MPSPSSVLTLGIGSWGSVNDMITLGYGSAEPAVQVPLAGFVLRGERSGAVLQEQRSGFVLRDERSGIIVEE